VLLQRLKEDASEAASGDAERLFKLQATATEFTRRLKVLAEGEGT
jgi:hypothetical protein